MNIISFFPIESKQKQFLFFKKLRLFSFENLKKNKKMKENIVDGLKCCWLDRQAPIKY